MENQKQMAITTFVEIASNLNWTHFICVKVDINNGTSHKIEDNTD